MKRNSILSIQKIAARHKFSVALFIVTALSLSVANRSMGNCNTTIPSQTPINELNGTYRPNQSPPPGCTTMDAPCNLPDYPCQGGLYLNGSNQQPSDHLTEGKNRATEIANGSGRIVLLSIGMCNAWLKFGQDPQSFIKTVCPGGPPCSDNSLNSNLVIVNGAQAGADAVKWAMNPNDPNARVWRKLLDAGGILDSKGVDPSEVQVIWSEHALIIDNQHTPLCTPFPEHAYTLRDRIEDTLRNIHTVFPNCKIVYLSPRAYAYTLDFHSPEPKAYQTGFADKWVMLDQLQGHGNIGYDVAPWIAWGPYLWTDGANERSDHLTWLCSPPPGYSDVQDDFVHPSTDGVKKVVNQLIAFFKTDPTATPWFLKQNAAGAQLTASLTPSLPSTIHVGDSVHFTATATSNQGTIVSYLWTFDDGESASSASPSDFTRDFKVPGTYNIRFTAIDSAGNHKSKSGLLTVQ